MYGARSPSEAEQSANIARFEHQNHMIRLTTAFALAIGLIGVCFGMQSPVAAQESFEALRGNYLELLKQPLEQQRPLAELEQGAQAFERFAECKGCKDRDEALLFASRFYRGAFAQSGDNSSIIQALKLLTEIENTFPNSPFIDDAIVEKGDAFLLLGDRERARTQYMKLILNHGSSNLMRLAQDKLLALEPSLPAQLTELPEEHVRASISVPKSKHLVVLDPGHGGEDTGAHGENKLVEKDIVLDIAVQLKKRLENNGILVELTREDDTFISLGERTTMANTLQASLFVSLHVNASPTRRLSGYQTFYLDNTDDAASKRLAERENSSLGLVGTNDDIAFMVSDLIQNGKLKDSIIVANLVHKAVLTQVRSRWTDVRDLGIRKGPFFVLVGAHMPCILSELFFIDNKRDSERLAQDSFRSDLVEGLYKGILEYLERK